MTARMNPVKMAMDVFLEIKREVKQNEKLGSRLRTRAREVPELIKDVGLIPALSFCYAKAKGEGEEAKAYELYLKAILSYLKNLGVLGIDVNEALDKPAETLENLYSASPIIKPLLTPFLIEFKRLCEATWKPERQVKNYE